MLPLSKEWLTYPTVDPIVSVPLCSYTQSFQRCGYIWIYVDLGLHFSWGQMKEKDRWVTRQFDGLHIGCRAYISTSNV